MRNVLICEGSTDYALLQYFMRKAYGWNDSKKDILQDDSKFARARTLVKNSDTLTIAGAGDCNKIVPCVSRILEINTISSNEEEFQKIVVVTDRDEIGTEEEFKNKLKKCFDDYSVGIEENIEHNEWIKCSCKNGRGRRIEFSLLLLVIPFETTGALETFLLEAVAKNDEYDAQIINKGNSFVDNIDPEKRYLNHRRYITKAKFDVYFSVRTAVGQFVERHDILKNVEWEKYLEIQTSFKKLEELSVNEES